MHILTIKNSKKYSFLLDFDGVICDTLNECLDTSYEAYRQLNNNLPNFPKKKWRKSFIKNRKLVRPPKNFYVLWHLIINKKLNTQSIKSFEKLSSQIKNKNFCKIFFKIRKNKIKNYPSLFVKNNPLYPGVLATWRNLEKKASIFIVSTKDKYSIKKIIKLHQLKARKVFGGLTGSKKGAINKIIRTYKILKKYTFFVDDNAAHLQDVQKTGINLILAKWGYGPSNFSKPRKIFKFPELISLLNNYK